MRSRFTVRPRNVLIGFIILYDISPFISRLTSSTISTYGYLLLLVLTFIMVAMRNSTEFANVYIASILPMIGYYLLTGFTSPDPIFLWGYKALLFVMPVILGVYLIYYSQDELDGLKKITIAGFFVTVITTILGVIQNPNAARYLATVDQASDEMNVLFGWNNVGGYTFVYTVVLLYPLIIYCYKQKKISLILAIVFSLSVVALAVFTEYATALLLVILSTALYFVKRELRTRDLLILGIVMIIMIVIFGESISSFLQFLGGALNSSTLNDRLLALSGGVTGIEQSDDNRIRLYREAIELFLKHPITGTMFGDKKGLGSHSQILITLAQHGIIGGFMMFCMYKKIYKLFFKPFDEVPGYGFYLWIFIEAIILSLVNTGFFVPVLALYAPVLFCAINGNTNTYQDDWS